MWFSLLVAYENQEQEGFPCCWETQSHTIWNLGFYEAAVSVLGLNGRQKNIWAAGNSLAALDKTQKMYGPLGQDPKLSPSPKI